MDAATRASFAAYGVRSNTTSGRAAQQDAIPPEVRAFLDAHPDKALEYLTSTTTSIHGSKRPRPSSHDGNNNNSNDDNVVDDDVINDTVSDEDEADNNSIVDEGRSEDEGNNNDIMPLVGDYDWRLIRAPDDHFDHPPASSKEASSLLTKLFNTASKDTTNEENARVLQGPLSKARAGRHWHIVVVINPNQCRRASTGKFYRSMFVSDPSMERTDMLCNLFCKSQELLSIIYGGTIICGNFFVEKRQGRYMLSLDCTAPNQLYILDPLVAHRTDIPEHASPQRQYALTRASSLEISLALLLREWYISYRQLRPSTRDSGYCFTIERTICNNSTDKYKVVAQIVDVIYPSNNLTGSHLCAAIRVSDWTTNQNLGTLGEWARTFHKTAQGMVIGPGKGSLSNVRRENPFLRASTGLESVLTIYLFETFALELANKKSQLHNVLIPGNFVILSGVVFYQNPSITSKQLQSGNVVTILDYDAQGASPSLVLGETLGIAQNLDQHSPFVGNLFRNAHTSIAVYTREEVMEVARKDGGVTNFPRALIDVGKRILKMEATAGLSDDNSAGGKAVTDSAANVSKLSPDRKASSKLAKTVTNVADKEQIPSSEGNSRDNSRKKKKKKTSGMNEVKNDTEMHMKDVDNVTDATGGKQDMIDTIAKGKKSKKTTKLIEKSVVEDMVISQEEMVIEDGIDIGQEGFTILLGEEARSLPYTPLPVVLTWPAVPFKFRCKLQLRRVIPSKAERFVAESKKMEGNKKEFRFALELEDPNTGTPIRVTCSGEEAVKFLGYRAGGAAAFRHADFEKRVAALVGAGSSGREAVDVCLVSYRVGRAGTVRFHIKDTGFLY